MTIIVDPPTTQTGPQIHVCTNGSAIAFQRVSPVDLRAWEKAWYKANPEPRPPSQEIDGQQIENRSHPDYLAVRLAWEESHGEACMRTVLLLGCTVDVDTAAVAAHRERAEQLDPPIKLDPNDRYVYLTSILITDAVDSAELAAKITGQIAANEEDVRAAEADFQRALSGDRIEALAPAEQPDYAERNV